MTDTHTHLYLPVFDVDRDAVMQRASASGVRRFFLPAIDSETTASMLAMEQRYPGCHAMIGLHPCSVGEQWEAELDHVANWLKERSFCAIGEIGLDFYWDTTYKFQQLEAFNRQMGWALEKGLPICIHTRNAMQETIDAVRPFAQRGLRGVFHCFGDSIEAARQIIDMGFFLGIGGVVTYKKSGLSETLKEVPPEHIVLETDAPYLTPVPHRGKRNESSYLTHIISSLCEIYALTQAELETITDNNAVRLFGIE